MGKRGKTFNHISPDDVIGAIIAYSELEKFTSEKSKFHRIIKSLLDNYKDRVSNLLLEEFIFSQEDIYPFSKLLESVLIRLQIPNIITADNPTYERYRMENSSRTFMKNNAENLFSPSQLSIIKEMANEFKKKAQA